MFGSRKNRRQYTPPTLATVNPNAATAAVSAFNLSSAAAAAAIRAIPLPATNVAEVQTPRTLRRSASVSSQGSRRAFSPVPSLRRAAGMGGRGTSGGLPTLRHKGSASSMSERSFRSPSPHHRRNASTSVIASSSPPALVAGNSRVQSAATSAAAAATAAGNRTGHANSQSLDSRSRSLPPVPSVPKHLEKRRTVGPEMAQQSLQLASQQTKAARSSWFGGASVRYRADVRAPAEDSHPSDATDSSLPQDGRPSSRSSSINFSYPGRARVGSPPLTGPTLAKSQSEFRAEEAMAAPATAAVTVPIARLPVRAASSERVPKSSYPSVVGSRRRSASTSRAVGVETSSQQDQALVYDPNSRRMVPRAELLLMEQEVLAMEGQARPRKKKQAPAQASAQPTKGSIARLHAHDKKPPLPRQQSAHVVPVAPVAQAVALSSPASKPSQPAQRQPAVAAVPELSQSPAESVAEKDTDEYLQATPALSISASTPSSPVSSLAAPQTAAIPHLTIKDEELEVGANQSPRAEEARSALAKRPSHVREEPELEKEEEKQKKPAKARSEQAGAEASMKRPLARSSAAATAVREVEQPVNPARTAHFAPISEGLSVQRYSPPPRSISPRKSAMKHTSSPRDNSPTEGASDAIVSGPPQNEPNLARKKSNRVSFTDENTVVMHGNEGSSSSAPSLLLPSLLPAAPDPPSSSSNLPTLPAHRRMWFSNIGRGKKNDLIAGLDDDQIMKPRPALPSFGSIRERAHPQTKQLEERALMRPQSPPSPAVPGMLGTSSDHAMGLILAQEQAASTRNTANTSRFREPLPPVVTSVEGSGYESDSSTSITSNAENESGLAECAVAVPSHEMQESSVLSTLVSSAQVPTPQELGDFAARQEGVPADQEDTARDQGARDGPRNQYEEDDEDDDITPIATPAAAPLVATKRNSSPLPEISVTSASQESLDATKPSPTGSFFDVPGTFPEESDSPTKAAFGIVPVGQAILEPSAVDDDDDDDNKNIDEDEDEDDICAMQPPGVLAAPMPTLLEEPGPNEADEDDTDTSVYSDACEDLSDAEGDGFLSLNAVVKSPIRAPSSPTQPKADRKTKSPSPSPSKQSRGPFSAGLAARAVLAARTDAQGLPFPADQEPELEASRRPVEDDWEKVKAFWRSLSVEKRAQLEQAAREEGGAKGDLQETTAEKRLSHQKKPAERHTTEQPTIQGRPTEPAEPTVPAGAQEETAKSELTPEQQPGQWAEGEIQPSQAVLPRIRRSMRETNRQRLGPSAPSSSVVAPAESFRPKRRDVLQKPVDLAPALTQGQIKKSSNNNVSAGLRRRGSDSSESSFKRIRTDDNSGGSGLRKTLRRGSNASSPEVNRSSRFSLRSLSPAGSTPRGANTRQRPLAHERPESPQLRKSLRSGSGPGHASSKMAGGTMRTSLSSPARTLRTAPKNRDSSGGGLLSSGGGKLLRLGQTGSASRFEDSSDDDDDFIIASSGAMGRNKTKTPARPIHSRFADSSDEDAYGDDINSAVRLSLASAATAKTRKQHVMTTSLRPASAAEGGRGRFYRHISGERDGDGPNIGTSSIRRSRSGRGELGVSSSYAGAAAAAAAAAADDDEQTRQQQQLQQERQHRRRSSTSSFMSVLRRKKNSGGVGSAGGGRTTRGQNSTLHRGGLEDEDDGDEDGDENGNNYVLSGSGSGNGNGNGISAGGWPLQGTAGGGSNTYQTTTAVSLLPERRKKKFPALRKMFRLDD